MASSELADLTALSVPATEDLLYVVDDPSGTPLDRKLTLDRLGGLFLPGLVGGRLTTESGVPATGASWIMIGMPIASETTR